MSTNTNQEDRAKAEDLRLQGNDAYQTDDFERALELYQESASLFPQANTLSNTAAVLHKLGRYPEATQAAKRATEVDPKWAKGWWRRGLASELEKDFHMAHKYYETAARLDSKNQVFRKHLASVKQRLNMIEDRKGPNTWAVQDPEPETTMDFMDTDTIKSYRNAQQLLGGPIYTLGVRYAQYQEESGASFPTSEQYLFHGIIKWITGLKCAIADLSCGLDPNAQQYGEALKRRFLAGFPIGPEELAQSERLLGGLPTAAAFDDMISAFAHLGGQKVFMEMAPGRICPQPQSLSRYVGFQILALLGCVQKWMDVLQERDFDFGPGMKCAPGVLEAYDAFFANLKAPPIVDISDKSKECTPQEIVDYVMEQVQAGRTWAKGGLRSYVVWQYRGSILFATVMRSMQFHKRAYERLKWSREFITLLDAELKVTENESYDIHGSIFRKSLRVGVLMAELDLFSGLFGNKEPIEITGPQSMGEEIDLCLQISAMAKWPEDLGRETDYWKAMDDVTYCRKPLAVAHALIAHRLNILRDCPPAFIDLARNHGLTESMDLNNYDPSALIAEHYRIAAENELPDAAEGTIYCWGYAANFAQSDSNPQRTLGELRKAINTAKANEAARNLELFGDNLQKNGQYESIAKLTAAHFGDQPDSFVAHHAHVGTNRQPRNSHSFLPLAANKQQEANDYQG